MASRKKKPTPLTAAQQKILTEQTITLAGPGTVLRDFAAFLDFVAEQGKQGFALTGASQLPAMKLLVPLNERMARPMQVDLQRPTLKSFPHLAGLYLLLRSLGLGGVEVSAKKTVLRLDEAALANWRALNPTEQYFMLLETWMLRADTSVLGDRSFGSCALRLTMFLQELAKGNSSDFNRWTLQYTLGYPNLAMLEALGLFAVQTGDQQAGQAASWNVTAIEVTPWGESVFALLAQSEEKQITAALPKESIDPVAVLEAFFAASSAPALDFSLGCWQAIFQPFFPEWRQNLALPEMATREGLFVFRVALGKVWRRISIPSALTLLDLGNAILQAFKFDNDHLHCFTYRNRFGAMTEVNHPACDDPPYSDEVLISTLPLRLGETMIYLFDFGDEWEFAVQLESIEPPNNRQKKPRVLESFGKAPEQYPDWDEF